MDKKILKEFLRLKWNETKWFIKYPFSIVSGVGLLIGYPYYKLAIYLAYKFMRIDILGWPLLYGNLTEPSSDNLLGGYGFAFIIFIIGGFIVFGIFSWIKSNWKQATKNVYPNKRRKK